MEYFIPVVSALIVGLIMGAAYSRRSTLLKSNHVLNDQRKSNLNDQRLFVEALAREYAQIFFQRTPKTFLEIEARVFDRIHALQNASDSEVHAQKEDILSRYSNLEDFDKIKLRDFVIFSENALGPDLGELTTAYEDCSIYRLLLKGGFQANDVRRAARNYVAWAIKNNEKYLDQYAAEYQDSQFLYRCIVAVRQYAAVNNERKEISRRLDAGGVEYDYQEVFGRDDSSLLYKTDECEVHHINHIAETCIGIKFLDTGECAVQSLFFDDKAYQSWSRVDENFEPLEDRQSILSPLLLQFLTIPFDILEEKRSNKNW